MEKSKKTLKMIGICIIGLVIVVAVNMLKKPEDPFKNPKDVGFRYQHIEEKNLLNNSENDTYFVYFYETGNKQCEEVNDDVKKTLSGHSNLYFFNVEDTTLKIVKDFEYKKLDGPVIGKKTVKISGMHCDHCVRAVTEAINKIDGASAKVNLKKKEAVVSYEKVVEDAAIREAVEKAGYTVQSIQG